MSCQVVIIGAGAAGLQCAHQLILLGLPADEIVVLEARNRIGGRIYTTTERRFPRCRHRSTTSAGASLISRTPDDDEDNHSNMDDGDGSAAPVEFAMDHGAAWVHGTSVPWGYTGFDNGDSQESAGSAAVPFMNPMMKLLHEQHGRDLYGRDDGNNADGSQQAPGVLNPVFEGNPWTRPRTVLRNKLVVYRDGQRVSKHVVESSIQHHFSLMQRVSDHGNELYQRGEGMETARQSLRHVLDLVDTASSNEPNANGDAHDDPSSTNSSITGSVVRSVSKFFVHLIECWNGAPAEKLQLTEFVRDDPVMDDSHYVEDGSFRGPHCTVTPGMRTILEPLLRDGVQERVLLNQAVSCIQNDCKRSRVVIRTQQGLVVHGRACVNTMPIGVLAEAVRSGVLVELSDEKQRALASTQMGCYKKVFLTFDRIFWPRDPPFLGLVRSEAAADDVGDDDENAAEASSSPLGPYLLIDNLWACRDVPCLEAVLFGPAGHWATGKSDEIIRDAVLEFMAHAMGRSEAMKDARCVDVHVTRWEEDPYSRGAYSSVAVGASIRHVQELTRPEWDGRLVLSGEACISEFEGSVHSALMSGADAAAAIHEFLRSSKQTAEVDREQIERSEEASRFVMLA
jgi:monoamine oxidase